MHLPCHLVVEVAEFANLVARFKFAKQLDDYERKYAAVDDLAQHMHHTFPCLVFIKAEALLCLLPMVHCRPLAMAICMWEWVRRRETCLGSMHVCGCWL